MNEKELIEKVKDNPEYIKEIENPSEAVQLAAVTLDGYVIKHIKNPSEAVQLAALEYEEMTLMYVENPTMNVQLKAIDADPWNLYYIKNPIAEVVVNAIEADNGILNTLESWLDDEDSALDYSSEGLFEGLRQLENLDELKIQIIANLSYKASRKKESIFAINGIIFEEPIYTSIKDIFYYFLGKEASSDYDYFLDFYNSLLEADFFKFDSLEGLVNNCRSYSDSDSTYNYKEINLFGYGCHTYDYRYGISITKINFNEQHVIENLHELKKYIDNNNIDSKFEHGMYDFLISPKYVSNPKFTKLLPAIIMHCAIDDYCVIKCNDNLYLITIES